MDKSVNVCMLIWQYWPATTGGSESQCRKLVSSLAARDIGCRILTARVQRTLPRREIDSNSLIVRIPIAQTVVDSILAYRRPRSATLGGSGEEKLSRPSVAASSFMRRWNAMSFMLGAFLWLLRHRSSIDVIHVHIGEWLAGYAGFIGGILGIPVVCKIADMPALQPMEDYVPFKHTLCRYRNRIHFIALHQAIRQELLSHGLDTCRITCIPNGVGIPSQLANPSSGMYVLCVGNFTQGASHKGFDVLFAAWAEVCKVIPEVELVMVGRGNTSDWFALLSALGCADRVRFAGYAQDPSSYYQNAAVFALASRHEGMSNALLEAQAYGVPAVVSDIPGNRAVVENGKTGVIVPVGDADALAAALIVYLKDSQKRDCDGSAARCRMVSQFSMEHVTAKYLDLYAKISKINP
jgi:glycosyltransferase involved in cell wall biosynthesis